MYYCLAADSAASIYHLGVQNDRKSVYYYLSGQFCSFQVQSKCQKCLQTFVYLRQQPIIEHRGNRGTEIMEVQILSIMTTIMVTTMRMTKVMIMVMMKSRFAGLWPNGMSDPQLRSSLRSA